MNPNDSTDKITLMEQLGCFSLLFVSLILNIATPFIIIKITNYIVGYEFVELCNKNYFIIYLLTIGLMVVLVILIAQWTLTINKIKSTTKSITKSIWKKR